MQLKLFVIRTNDMQQLVSFYTLLGLSFEYHKHGNSPYHYAANVEETVMEIYPLAKNQIGADNNLRLGFAINDFDNVLKMLGDAVINAPMQTDWGYMAIAQDPDGRKIELYKK